MPLTTTADLVRMRDNLFFDGPDGGRKLSRFWALLVLASVIASAGVVGDSTATVIGAMIVAPLMIPILGTVLAIVTADRANVVRSVVMVAGGAVAAVAVGYVFGLITPFSTTAETSSQVAGRVSPRLIDLIAALATGAVGAFAQCRDDVSDTLPGVAIAISLVPPLAVVGLTLEAGAYQQASGATLLFLTNVAAILISGCIVMAIFGVQRVQAGGPSGVQALNRRHAVTVVAALVVLVALPLGSSSVRLGKQTAQARIVSEETRRWADDAGWRLVNVEPREDYLAVSVAGPLPAPDTAPLRDALAARGLARTDVRVSMTPEVLVDLGRGQAP